MLQGWLGKTRVLLPRQRQDMGLFAERHFDVDQPTPPQIEFARFPMSHCCIRTCIWNSTSPTLPLLSSLDSSDFILSPFKTSLSGASLLATIFLLHTVLPHKRIVSHRRYIMDNHPENAVRVGSMIQPG